MSGFLLLLLAGALLVAGAEVFAENAARAGRQLGVNVLAVGLLLAGAEPEELCTAVLAAVQGRTAISVGDALGANVTMLSAVVGAAALLRGVPVGGRVSRYLLGATLSSVVAALTTLNGTVTRWEGGGLLVLYVTLVGLVWRLEQAPPAVGEFAELEADAPRAHRGTAHGLLLALVGIGVMAAGGWAAVEGAARVVATLGVADGAVGATLVALATTAELFALVWSAARRGAASRSWPSPESLARPSTTPPSPSAPRRSSGRWTPATFVRSHGWLPVCRCSSSDWAAADGECLASWAWRSWPDTPPTLPCC